MPPNLNIFLYVGVYVNEYLVSSCGVGILFISVVVLVFVENFRRANRFSVLRNLTSSCCWSLGKRALGGDGRGRQGLDDGGTWNFYPMHDG